MTTKEQIPAAQYLRMSTEDQKYSLENQAAAIQAYAEINGFLVVRSYSDTAKSGVVLRRRAALQQLLKDVVSGGAGFRSILVYDVSRWGRFQDIDEAAHYEFLCKSAGIPVVYCAETFSNDGTLPSLIMKSLKRTMAGEYSRELGVKVLAGQKRLAKLGFKQGGLPGFGLRRFLLSADRCPKQQLDLRERKSIATDRVILVPGPPREVEVVRDIYRMFLGERRTPFAIAQDLNRRQIAYFPGSDWDYQAVHKILTHPKYAGCYVFGRTSSKLHTRMLRLPRSEWIMTSGAFEPIIAPALFEEAQKMMKSRTVEKTDEEILGQLKSLLVSEGRLTLSLIQHSPDMPSPSTYRHRFGSLRNAYHRIGYGQPEQFGGIDARQQTWALRDRLMAQITALFPDVVSVFRRGGRWRPQLRLSTGRFIAVIVARSVRIWKDTIRWKFEAARHERELLTLLARLDHRNQTFLDFYLFPGIVQLTKVQISLDDRWLKRGKRLTKLSQFLTAISQIHTTNT